ncbi:hypothetical protein [Changchengzhania lutea]|uniref:hypothetical protein n=1 Tax=Changchengzhania lutea TaxID=2049305 RepID=UPI00115DCD05|nr:hypothetical protein [Changchengzhania lutea]
MKEKTSLEKLKEAWDSMPPGAKNRLYNDFGHTNQNVASILKNGRKDQSVIQSLLSDVKTVSDEITEEIKNKNEKVQAL